MVIMNAKLDYHLHLDYILNELYKGVKGLNINAVHVITIILRVQEPEDLNEYFYTSSFLEDKKVIKKYSKGSSFLEEMETDNDYGREQIYSTKFKYKLVPKNLIQYMIETSRIPKYTLTRDKKRRLILNGKYLLVTTQFDSPNDYFIEHCIEHGRGLISLGDLMKKAGKKPQRFHIILGNLNIAPNFVDIFFPNVKNSLAQFRMNVTTEDLVGSEINEAEIDKFMKKLTKIES